MSLKAACFSIPGQQVCLLTNKGTVPELKSLNKQRGRISYDNIYLTSAEHATLTENIFAMDEAQGDGPILLHKTALQRIKLLQLSYSQWTHNSNIPPQKSSKHQCCALCKDQILL